VRSIEMLNEHLPIVWIIVEIKLRYILLFMEIWNEEKLIECLCHFCITLTFIYMRLLWWWIIFSIVINYKWNFERKLLHMYHY
jgi:hypothetical protein